MAAALQQYQACVGIMVRLQVEDLTLLKLDFDRIGRGLTLHEFVSAMLDRVRWEPANVVAFIEDLVELFAQVDVNGDGAMEWEEFTSAIIEGGMSATGDAAEWRDVQYEEDVRFTDVMNREPPKRVQLAPEFRRLLLLENARPVVEIIDPSTLCASEGVSDSANSSDALGNAGSAGDVDDVIDSSSSGGRTGGDADVTLCMPTLTVVHEFHPLCYIAGYRRDQDAVRSERSPVQALKYLSHVELLAVSAGDLKLSFWATNILTASSASALETPVPLAVVHTPRPQRVLEWNASTQRLFSISADLLITVWRVVREPTATHDSKRRCDVTRVVTLKQHTDLLQDLLVLNADTLVSCGMDSMIYLWDTSSLQLRAARKGHRRGVRLLTKLSNQLFLSAGFECDVLAWDIAALATTPVFTLAGHTAPVCCIQLIASAPFAAAHERRMARAAASSSSAASAVAATALLADQAITVDDDGWFKWWRLASVFATESDRSTDRAPSGGQCLQTFRLGSDTSPWRVHSLAVLQHGQCVLAAGPHKLKLLQRVRHKPPVLASSAVLFNSVSCTLLTTTDRDVRVWDAASGVLLRTYSSVVASEITCVDLDARQRKIVLGTQRGELVVLNYLTGAVLTTWTPHARQVAALVYCKEDQCVLTASWDRSLRLYDDNASANALLRCVMDAHDADITSLAFCYALSLVATGAADGVIKLWDYVYFVLEDVVCAALDSSLGSSSDHASINCAAMKTAPASTVAAHASVTADVNALEFVEPYPLLVSGHENGLMCIWRLASTYAPTTLLVRFDPLLVSLPLSSVTSNTALLQSVDADTPVTSRDNNSSSSNCSDSNGTTSSNDHAAIARSVSVSCCQAFYDEQGGAMLAGDIRRGRFLLLSGSSRGDVCVSDISSVIVESGVRAFREESLPSSHARSYNPRRRFLRQGKTAKRLQRRHARTSDEQSISRSSSVSDAAGDDAADDDAAPHDDAAAAPQQIDAASITCVAKWRAHDGNIRCLRTVDEPRAVLTCASDKRARVWSFNGEWLGDITRSNSSSGSSATATAAPIRVTPVAPLNVDASAATYAAASSTAASTWRWEVDVESAARAKREQAEAIWDTMKASKLRSTVARHESIVELSRRRRQLTARGHGLGASASASALPSAAALSSEPERPLTSHTLSDARDTSNMTRLFAQLEGKTTWKLSELQIAREHAWVTERAKFQQRMQQILKNKTQTAPAGAAATKPSVDAYGQPLRNASGIDGVNNQMSHGSGTVTRSECDWEALRTSDDNDDTTLMPAFETAAQQQLPYDDKDNWSVGSLNRERQMYSNLHHETVRRSLKSVASLGKIGRSSASSSESIDLTPSPFLLEKLGASCVVLEHLPHKHTRRTNSSSRVNNSNNPRSLPISASRHAKSTPALATLTRPPEQTNDCSSTVAGTTDRGTGNDSSSHVDVSHARTAPHHSMQQLIQHYDALLQQQQADDDDEQLRSTSSMPASVVSHRALSSPTRRGSESQSLQQPQVQDRRDARRASIDADALSTSFKKALSAPSNRRRASTSDTTAPAAIASEARLTSSAKARRHAPLPHDRSAAVRSAGKHLIAANATGSETAAAKKQRMRADAALLRQDRFGRHSRDDVVNIYRTFQKIDKDASGTITLRELRDGAALFAGASLQDNITSIFSSIDRDQSGLIDLPELLAAVFGGSSSEADTPPSVLQDIGRFCQLLENAERAKKNKKRQLSPEQLKELYALFQLYDLDHDGNIDVDELFSALQYNEKFYDSNSRSDDNNSSSATQMTREDVQRIVAHFDVNTNATLDMNEFIELFRDDALVSAADDLEERQLFAWFFGADKPRLASKDYAFRFFQRLVKSIMSVFVPKRPSAPPLSSLASGATSALSTSAYQQAMPLPFATLVSIWTEYIGDGEASLSGNSATGTLVRYLAPGHAIETCNVAFPVRIKETSDFSSLVEKLYQLGLERDQVELEAFLKRAMEVWQCVFDRFADDVLATLEATSTFDFDAFTAAVVRNGMELTGGERLEIFDLLSQDSDESVVSRAKLLGFVLEAKYLCASDS